MADDDADAREEVHEEEAAPAPPVPSDEVAAALVAQFPDGVFVDSHGQAVVHVPREHRRHFAADLIRDAIWSGPLSHWNSELGIWNLEFESSIHALIFFCSLRFGAPFR